MPTLHTRRLLIQPFTLDDLDDIHPILNESFPAEPAVTRDERRQWLQWAVLNYEQLAQLRQPPYGDRAIVLKPAGVLIGACGFVPCLMPFAQLPALRGAAP
ncbi:MAG: GNAT family N-acetyltransferase, partial [Chloroflexi bacterium]|nr:GNAT family N-acetyltransferase [Chloroflexota bacterium]